MVIKKIEIKSNKVKIHLDNDSSFEISVETYINNELLLDSQIDNKKIDFLKSQDNLISVKKMLFSKLTKKRLSKKECLIFLLDNGLNEKETVTILKNFEENFLINDNELAQIIVESAVTRKKGVNFIIEKLKHRFIEGDYTSIIELYLDKEKYESNIVYQLDKYFKLGRKKSKIELKKYLLIKMIDNGFLKEEVLPFLSKYEADEYGAVSMEVIKFFKNKEVNRENITKITKKLLSKGFNYVIIKEVIRESVNNETD